MYAAHPPGYPQLSPPTSLQYMGEPGAVVVSVLIKHLSHDTISLFFNECKQRSTTIDCSYTGLDSKFTKFEMGCQVRLLKICK